MRYSQQLALASGGIAAATAAGAWAAGRRERRLLEADAAAHAERRQRNGTQLAGHGLPGRPEPRVEGPGAAVWSQMRGRNTSADPGGPVH